jgi:hypothetical protein
MAPGEQIGRWTVARAGIPNARGARWFCRCICGRERLISEIDLPMTKKQLCRCEPQTRNSHHGLTKEPEYRIWSEMLQRCGNPKSQHWRFYGGRGISVCDRWRSAALFYADMGPRPSPKHSIDRINNDGNYEPGNCRWATRDQQMANSRASILIDVDGERLSHRAAAKRFGISYSTLQHRISAGVPVHLALRLPSRLRPGVSQGTRTRRASVRSVGTLGTYRACPVEAVSPQGEFRATRRGRAARGSGPRQHRDNRGATRVQRSVTRPLTRRPGSLCWASSSARGNVSTWAVLGFDAKRATASAPSHSAARSPHARGELRAGAILSRPLSGGRVVPGGAGYAGIRAGVFL